MIGGDIGEGSGEVDSEFVEIGDSGDRGGLTTVIWIWGMFISVSDWQSEPEIGDCCSTSGVFGIIIWISRFRPGRGEGGLTSMAISGMTTSKSESSSMSAWTLSPGSGSSSSWLESSLINSSSDSPRVCEIMTDEESQKIVYIYKLSPMSMRIFQNIEILYQNFENCDWTHWSKDYYW